MKYSYTAIALAAFGLSSVFAAPTTYSVDGVKCVDSDLTCITKRGTPSGFKAPPTIVAGAAAGPKGILAGAAVVPRGVIAGAKAGPGGVIAGGEVGPRGLIAGAKAGPGGILVGAAAAPRDIPSTLDGLPSNPVLQSLPVIPGVVAKVEPIGKPIVEPIVDGALTVVGGIPVVGGVVGSLPRDVESWGSAGPPAGSPVVIIGGAVLTLKKLVATELLVISTILKSDVVESIVPTVEGALKKILAGLQAAVSTIVPCLAGKIVPLAIEEVHALITLLCELHTIISDIEATLVLLVDTVAADVLALLKPEITAVLAIVFPLISPVVSFAFSIAAIISDPEGLGNDVRTAAFGLTGIAGTLLSPVGSILGPLLKQI